MQIEFIVRLEQFVTSMADKGLSYPERVARSRKNNGRAHVMILCSMNVFVVDLTPQKKRLLNSVDIFCLFTKIYTWPV
jgi:hypothetical protein